MDTDGAIVIDLRRPDWASSAEAYLAGFSADPPKSLCFEVDADAQANAEEAQLIYALTKFAAAVDTPVSVEGDADALTAALASSGMPPVFSAEGDSSP